MKIERALVVYRKSMFQIYVREHQEQWVQLALKRGDAVAAALRDSDRANHSALEEVERVLERYGIETVVRWRAHLRTTHQFDLVVSVGGDGTLLDTSHRILDGPPLLGINSDPQRSVGALCAGTVRQLPEILEALLAGRLRPQRRTRLRVRLDGQDTLGPTLNDILFAHACPAGLSRFELAVLPVERAAQSHSGHDGLEFRAYRGSGLWVSTATGSTAAIRSAGGRHMPPGSRWLQYRVREPYRAPGAPVRLPTQGRVPPGQALVLITRMRRGMLWADGAHRQLPLKYSQQVLIDRHPCDLLLIR